MKYPLVRSRLLKLWREARATAHAGRGLGLDRRGPGEARAYTKKRGLGGFVRATWDEVNEIIAAANAYTAKTYGPDRVIGFSPIPAMSMVSYAAGSRYLSLLGGVCMSFYDWYCDLPPASPQTWGEQTDVPESADWYNSGFLILWGSNVPQTRTPDAHFYTEARYAAPRASSSAPTIRRPRSSATSGCSVKQGTDAALAMAMGHVILSEFHVDRQARVFRRLLPPVHRHADAGAAGEAGRHAGAGPAAARLRLRRQRWARPTIPNGRPSPSTRRPAASSCRSGSVGFRWGEKGKWNLEEKETQRPRDQRCGCRSPTSRTRSPTSPSPISAIVEHEHFAGTDHPSVLVRKVPVKRVQLADGEALVATVFDLFVANYGVDRGFGGEQRRQVLRRRTCPTRRPGPRRSPACRATRSSRSRASSPRNAEKTNGRSMVIIGAAMNHWYHCDMNYRGIINMLVMCGCVGQSGGGWSHYVGQEKLRPQTGWLPLAFALDWSRPPRQQNSTSFFYAHTDQWRYETLDVGEILSPTAPAGPWDGALIDYNIRAERMGWLPSAPQLETNPLEVAKRGRRGRAGAEGLRRAAR